MFVVGCPKGQFMSEQGSSCITCGYGTYQNESNSVDCNVCPQNTNTTSTGAESGTLCRGKHSSISVFQTHFIRFIQLVVAFSIKPIDNSYCMDVVIYY